MEMETTPPCAAAPPVSREDATAQAVLQPFNTADPAFTASIQADEQTDRLLRDPSLEQVRVVHQGPSAAASAKERIICLLVPLTALGGAETVGQSSAGSGSTTDATGASVEAVLYVRRQGKYFKLPNAATGLQRTSPPVAEPEHLESGHGQGQHARFSLLIGYTTKSEEDERLKLLFTINQVRRGDTTTTDVSANALENAKNAVSYLATGEFTTTSLAPPTPTFSFPSIIRRSSSSSSALKLNPSSSSSSSLLSSSSTSSSSSSSALLLNPPAMMATTVGDLSQVQESLLRVEEELRTETVDTKVAADASVAGGPDRPSSTGPTPGGEASSKEGSQALTGRASGGEVVPTPEPAPTADNGDGFDLFCFNEGNSDEIDTSKDDAVAEDDAANATFKAESMEVEDGRDEGFTSSGRPAIGGVDEKYATGRSQFPVHFDGQHAASAGHEGDVRVSVPRDVDDIGIYAEEEIGDEWEEEMEAGAGGGGGGLDDSREEDERDASAASGLQSMGDSGGLGGGPFSGSSYDGSGGPSAQGSVLQDAGRREKDKEGDRDQMWKAKFDQLKEFHDENGNCEVKGRKNKALSAWIRRQRYLWRNGKLSDERKVLLEGIGFVWAQRNNKKATTTAAGSGSGKRAGLHPSSSSHTGVDGNSENDSDELLAAEHMTEADEAAAMRRREGTAAAALEGADREKLGLDRYIKKRRGSLSGGGGNREDSGSGGGEEDDVDDSAEGKAASNKRKRVKNYMTKGRTDAWMRKYEEFRNKNLRGDFSWKDNVQLRAWVRQQRYLWRNGKLSKERYHMLNKAGFDWEPEKGKKERRRRSGGKSKLRKGGDGADLSGDDGDDWDDEDDWEGGLDEDMMMMMDDDEAIGGGGGGNQVERLEEEDEMVALIIRHVDEIGKKNEEKRREWEKEEEERRKRDDERQRIEAEWSAIQGEWQEIEQERRKLDCEELAMDRKRRKIGERKRIVKEAETRVRELLEKSETLHQRLDAEQEELNDRRRRVADEERDEHRRMQRERDQWNATRERLETEIRELNARLALKEALALAVKANGGVAPADVSMSKHESSAQSLASDGGNVDSQKEMTNGHHQHQHHHLTRKRKRGLEKEQQQQQHHTNSDKEQEIVLKADPASDDAVSAAVGLGATTTAASSVGESRPNARTKKAIAGEHKRQKKDAASTSTSATTAAAGKASAKKTAAQDKTERGDDRHPHHASSDNNGNKAATDEAAGGTSSSTTKMSTNANPPSTTPVVTGSISSTRRKRRGGGGASALRTPAEHAVLPERTVQPNQC